MKKHVFISTETHEQIKKAAQEYNQKLTGFIDQILKTGLHHYRETQKESIADAHMKTHLSIKDYTDEQ